MGMPMVEYLGWLATAVFVASYLCRGSDALKRVQMVGALMWVVYGSDPRNAGRRRQPSGVRAAGWALSDSPADWVDRASAYSGGSRVRGSRRPPLRSGERSPAGPCLRALSPHPSTTLARTRDPRPRTPAESTRGYSHREKTHRLDDSSWRDMGSYSGHCCSRSRTSRHEGGAG